SAVAATRRPVHARPAPSAAGTVCSPTRAMTDAAIAGAVVPDERRPNPVPGAGSTVASTPAPRTVRRSALLATAAPAPARTNVTNAAPSARWWCGPAGDATDRAISASAATGTHDAGAGSAAETNASRCEQPRPAQMSARPAIKHP